MPIKGLTDRGLAFPEIGQVRKGAKKDPNSNKPGADLTYFRVEFDEREQETAKLFYSIYGSQPEAIRIVLPFNEIERMWDAWMEAYTAGRMVARADGEYFTYLINAETNEVEVKGGIDVQTGQPRPFFEGKPIGFYTDKHGQRQPILCKPTGRLRVIIPELQRAAYLTVMTTSVHDIANISDQLRAFQQLNGGQLAGIPLVLRRRPKKISTPNQDGTRARRVKWLISIEADPEWVKRALTEAKRLALPGNGLSLLPEGEHEPEDHTPVEYDEGEYEEASANSQTLIERLQVLGEMATKNGTRIDAMTDQQLSYLVEKVNGELGDAAFYLVSEPTEDELAEIHEFLPGYEFAKRIDILRALLVKHADSAEGQEKLL